MIREDYSSRCDEHVAVVEDGLDKVKEVVEQQEQQNEAADDDLQREEQEAMH